MTRNLIKKSCKSCGKPFLTYDKNIEYCNSQCKVKKDYDTHFGYQDTRPMHKTNCVSCGEEMIVRSNRARKYCNIQCYKTNQKRQRVLEDQLKPKKKRIGKPIDYENLNKIMERNRVFEDHIHMYRKNRDKI